MSSFATSILPCKLRHTLVVRSEPNRAAVAPPTRRHCGSASRTMQVCSSGFVQGNPLFGAGAGYAAIYITKCVFRLCFANYDSNASHTMQVCRPGRIHVRGQWRLARKFEYEMRFVFLATSILGCELRQQCLSYLAGLRWWANPC